MIDRNWQGRFLRLAQHIAGWSKDPTTQVGALLVQPETRLIVATGYNGLPRGIADLSQRLEVRTIKHAMTVHAEMNAVLQAGIAARGAWLFCTHAPCMGCAKAIVQAGVSTVVVAKGGIINGWADEQAQADALFQEAGVDLECY